MVPEGNSGPVADGYFRFTCIHKMILFGTVIPDKPQKILHVLLRPVRAIKSVPSANSKSKKIEV